MLNLALGLDARWVPDHVDALQAAPDRWLLCLDSQVT
jgi:hypothetical protein